ncbi:MAG: 3-dehydroquinate synthase [Verrucomicrobiales bacterium]|nr:3-dehydroquinate synthase [Verrucomicrobiales bacterium]
MMIERSIRIEWPHRVLFTRGVFEAGNGALGDLIAAAHEEDELPARLLVFMDGSLVEAAGDLGGRIGDYCRAWPGVLELAAAPVTVPGGEAAKNDWRQVEVIWELINEKGIDRHCYVVAIGGGAVLDMVGFAAATAHRGIRHIRMPSTTLSQGDGGVGVKNGVNYFGKKNWVGTFSVPFAVINDSRFIDLLPERERRAGIIEAIKVSLIRDRVFFEEMESGVAALGALEVEMLERVVQRSAELHVEHIATSGDPFEAGSARPLDFGHWVAHKLEQVSSFAVGHGEAVAIGMAVDLLYSREIGMLDGETVERVLKLIEGVGFELYSEWLESEEGGKHVILRGLEEFREHLGGRLTITLVPEIGKKTEVHEMDEGKVMVALEVLKGRVRSLCGG